MAEGTTGEIPTTWLIVESEVKEGMKKRYWLSKNLIKIGRSSDPDEREDASPDEKDKPNDIILPADDMQASRWHGAIRKVKNEYEYEDHSKNGTIICGTKLIKGKRVKLRHGDKIIISETCFRFYDSKDVDFKGILMDWIKGPCPG